MAQFTDYISELKSPSLKYHEDGSLPSHQDIESYLSGVEQMRQEFLSVISEKDDNVIRAYLDEVEQADKIIDKRGFINMRDIVIASAMDSGLNGAPYFLIQKSIDSRLHSSALSTITFIKSLLGENDSEPIHTSEIEERQEPIENNGQEEIIRGVKGLAQFLGIGTTKAQAIINSKILTKTKPAIQYYAGAWMFNRERLQDFITKNPEAFRDIKCPH